MKYKETLSLGFKRRPYPDDIWFNEYGYECFLMQYQLDKTHYLEWRIIEQDIVLYRTEKNGYDIIETWELGNDLSLIQNIIRLFGRIKGKSDTKNEY